MSNIKTFNSSKKSSRKSAFTLIELSIVLIIIGLLVAGVTGGASLIRSAQLRGVMSEARGYNVAVNAFRVQYDNLPGDYGTEIAAPVGLAGAVNSGLGNQDGRIQYMMGEAELGRGSAREGIIAWLHLINSGNIDDRVAINVPVGVVNNTRIPVQVVGQNIPDSKIEGLGWVFANTAGGNVLVATGNIPEMFSNASVKNQQFVATGALTPTDALSIDTKLDDGAANTGKVRASELLADGASPAQDGCFVGATYSTATTTKTCALEFTVDIS